MRSFASSGQSIVLGVETWKRLLKTYHHLAKNLVSFENMLAAAHVAARGKHDKANVQKFMYHLEENLVLLKEEMAAGTYKPRGYISFYIHDPKRRQIGAAAFRDRVVHHALCNIIEPIFDKTFIFDTYANRTGKGSHAAIRRAQLFIRQNRYVLKCDIKKYFATIDHEILKQHIRWRIADVDALWLVDLIIDNSNEQE
ncbi:MAG: hypothetical protein GXO75_07065, partial [Calditrichaeota bacterium]|nr:hypothetical protein [Calditrichota bacterium]